MQHALLDDRFLPDWAAFDAKTLAPAIHEALKSAKTRLEEIAAQPLETVTYESVCIALDTATEQLGRAWGYVGHLDSVCQTPELREAYNLLLPEVTEFYTSIPLNQALWERLKALKQKTEPETLSDLAARHLSETLADFKDAGADLEPADQDRLRTIRAELARLTQKFSENVLDATDAWAYVTEDLAELAGLPPSALETFQADAKANDCPAGSYRISLHMPSLLPVLKYADNAALRERCWRASSRVGWETEHDNTHLIQQILGLRQEMATLLGHAHFADLTTSRRMAKTGASALAFIEDLQARIAPAFQQEIQQLEAFAAHQSGQEPEPLEPWDSRYWAQKWREQSFELNEESLRPYFPIDRVKTGLFQITETLFGIRICRREGAPTWHEEVGCYDVFEGQQHLGTFYTDWHPRKGKRSGAWMNYLRTGKPGEPHLGLMCGNMSRPGGKGPALMTHDEVQTIFHEFGHLLHHLLSRVPVASLAGVNVAWDFVELPSQLLENWCWEQEALQLYARHHATDEPLPPELLEKMLRSRNFMSAAVTMRQLALGKLDLDLHIMARAAVDQDLETFADQSLEGYRARLKTPAPSILRQFTHLFSSETGYAAGYYSYKWAEVLDADAFSRFTAAGVLDPDTGRAFRTCILEKGASEAPEKLFRDFMGRDPDPAALLKRSGLG
jgi:oligopeptidase A